MQHNFIKTRGGGSGAVYKTFEKTHVFIKEDVPYLMASNPSVLKQHRQCKYYFISYLFCFQLWPRENIKSHSFLRVFYCRKMSGRFTLTDDQFCEYRRQLSLKQEDNFFQLDWGWGVVRNCDKKGNLLKLGLKHDFMKSGKSLWIPLQLCLFSDSEGVFGIWACGQCMPEVKGLSFQQQDRCVIESEICHHSRAILQLGENSLQKRITQWHKFFWWHKQCMSVLPTSQDSNHEKWPWSNWNVSGWISEQWQSISLVHNQLQKQNSSMQPMSWWWLPLLQSL